LQTLRRAFGIPDFAISDFTKTGGDFVRRSVERCLIAVSSVVMERSLFESTDPFAWQKTMNTGFGFFPKTLSAFWPSPWRSNAAGIPAS